MDKNPKDNPKKWTREEKLMLLAILADVVIGILSLILR